MIFRDRIPLLAKLGRPWVVAAVLGLFGYALAGFFLAPWLLGRYLPSYVAREFAQSLSLGQVRVNPFFFTLEVRDLRLADGEGEMLLSNDWLLADFELESIVRGAWTFGEIVFEAPVLHLLFDQTGRLNLARMIAKLPDNAASSGQESQADPVRLLCKRLVLTGGTVQVRDQSGPIPVAVAVAPVTIEVRNLATLPDSSGTFRAMAKLPMGGRLDWQGDVTLAPLTSHGTLHVADFSPAVVWEFFQDRIPLARPLGSASLDLDYRFVQDAGKAEFVVHPLAMRLRDLELRANEGQHPLLRLVDLQVTGARFDQGHHEVHLPTVTLRGGAFRARLDEDGRLDWLALLKSPTATAAGGPEAQNPRTSASEKPARWRLTVDNFTLADIVLHCEDRSYDVPGALDIDAVNLSLAVEAASGDGPPLLQLRDLAVGLQGIHSRDASGDQPQWSLAQVRLAGGGFDLAGRQIQAESLLLGGGHVGLERLEDGAIRQVRVLGPVAWSPGSRLGEQAAAPASSAWHVLLSRFELADFSLDYADQGFGSALQYGLRDLSLVAEGIDNESADPIRFSAQTRVAQGGTMTAAGALAQTGRSVSGRVAVEKLELPPLQPLLARYLRANLASGNLSLTGAVSYEPGQEGDKPELKADGGMKINALRLEEREGGERLLAWRELAVNGFDFSLRPAKLEIAAVQVQEPQVKIVVLDKGQGVNLARLAVEKESTAAPGIPPAAPAPVEDKPFPLLLNRVSLTNGVVEFADLSLVLPFATRIERFAGTALNINADPASRATLKFSGVVDQYGEADVSGTLAPLNPRQFMDLGVRFHNVELQPISPYTATFAGRRVASGRLDLDLGYKIDKNELQGDHRMVLRNFSLGERVESPKALALPLDLAIALLTDGEGKIDVAVPVRGNLENPEFSYNQVVWQAVSNMLTRLVTAPFQSLSALFASGTPQPDRVFFEPGQAEPSPPELEKLQQVAQVLNQRPQLLLTVHGAFARDLDGTSLREFAVRRALAARLGVALQAGDDPGPVAFTHAKTQQALEQLSGGDAAVTEFQAAYEEKTGVKAIRVNPALALLGKASDDLSFYEALFQHLVASATLAEEELHALAANRRDRVLRELREVAGLAPERLAVGTLEEAKTGESPVAIPLELGADRKDE